MSRQGIPFCLRPLYLPELRGIRTEIRDTFGTVEDRDMAQNSRCRLLMKELAPAVLYGRKCFTHNNLDVCIGLII